MLNVLKNHTISLAGFVVSVGLTLISIYVVRLTNDQSFLVFSTGALISVSLALIEQRVNSGFQQLEQSIDLKLQSKLELYALMSKINEEELRREVTNLARELSIGEIPWYIAATRVPQLYLNTRNTIYASNYSPTLERLYQWEDLPRLRGIVDVSRDLTTHGVRIERTFILRRSEVVVHETWDGRAMQVLNGQQAAGIRVRVLWAEDLEQDTLPPSRLSLMRNFTVFDEAEVLETTTVQLLWRRPHPRVQDFLKLRDEQLKYAANLDSVLATSRRPQTRAPVQSGSA